MWLAKIFGRTRDDSEPSMFSPHPAANQDPSLSRPSASRPSSPPPAAAGQAAARQAVSKAKGFDPYNSGAFRKASAWERVNKR
jgi:hypothetical protein